MLLLQKGPFAFGRGLYDDLLSLSTDTASRTFPRDRAVFKYRICNYWGKNRKKKSRSIFRTQIFDPSYDKPWRCDQLLVICSAVLTDTTFCVQGGTETLSKIVGNFYSTDSDKSGGQKLSASSQSKVFPVLYESLSSKQKVKVTYTNSGTG